MEVEPPVPAVPADVSIASPGARRRRSLPSAADGPSKKRSSNHVRPQPASPEVISSLIDSLSAISLPAHNHFENFPSVHGGSVSTPATPFQTHFTGDPLAYNGAMGIDLADNRHPRDNDLLYPDDAAEPPVVRTSKPPSGLSPLTAPKPVKKEKEHSLKNYMRAGCESTTSLQSVKSTRSVSSIGNISIEAGIPRHSTTSRTSSDSKRSARGTRGLMYMSSREKLKGKDTDRKRPAAPLSINASGSLGHDLLSAPKASLQPPSPKHIPTEEPIDEEPVVAESSSSAERKIRRGVSPLRNGISSRSSDEHDSPTRRGLIPERQSSLRHHESPSRKGKRGHIRRGKSHDSSKTKTVLEEDEVEMNPEDKILKELEAEENEVARRIKELKERKQMREKSAGKMPVGMAAGDSRSVSRVSPMTSPPLSPTSTVSSVSEIRAQDSKAAKAHKVLGISSSPNPPPRRTSRIPNLAEQRELLKQLGEHSDAEDETPLPIDYQLALQALERPSSPPASATSSSRGSKSNSVGTPVRSKSVAVGGRSAAGRKKTHSMIMGAATQPRSSSASEFPPLSNTSSRSTSEDYFTTVGSRHLSLNLSPSSAPTHGSKKKRWSHPDLPLKAEQMHNADVERGAVKPPPRPVIEERPSSVDSVDLAVEAYLDSPRLSQKVRSPQTGRVICFSEVGDPRGFAVFCCVGMGLTRYVMSFYDELALTLKLRLITADRPGVGESQSDSNGTPLSWPDDVTTICNALGITKFSLLAHSAGAVYALATALRIPQQIRGRVHLLAPWIPPSQMAPIGVHQDAPPGGQLPKSQRFLRTLPPSLLKIANSSFLSATSASITRNVPKTPNKKTRKSAHAPVQQAPIKDTRRESIMLMDQVLPTGSALSLAANNPTNPHHETAVHMKKVLSIAERERRNAFDERLTFAIWDRATSNANPATDLMVCLETRQTIGFRYEDITRGVVIHHGSKDSRVPVDNVRWLGRLMRRCEVRIIDGEQHGLMASAVVMGNVLTEVAKEWEDWTAVVQAGGKNADKRGSH